MDLARSFQKQDNAPTPREIFFFQKCTFPYMFPGVSRGYTRGQPLGKQMISALLQKGIICLNLVRIWYIFPTRTFVLNAIKESGIFFWGGGGWVHADKSLLDCESMG